MEDLNKVIGTDRLIALLGEIEQEISHEPIDTIRVTELLGEFNKEIIRFSSTPGRSIDLMTEACNSVLYALAELSLKYIHLNKDTEEALHCLQQCIDENKFQLPEWLTEHPEALTKHDVFNPPLNRSVGLTPRAGFGSPRHPTSWRHLLQHNLKKRFPGVSQLNSIAKYGGRAAIGLTLGEGAWDISAEANCIEHCSYKSDSCDNKSCRLFPYIDGLMIE
ncbi:MAG: hypothetical protein HQK99_03260 [Nitrospirae bacterium]|nr:hypothetical protein [Nitrospirota bacterium]